MTLSWWHATDSLFSVCSSLHAALYYAVQVFLNRLTRLLLTPLTICCGGFLMGHQHGSELLQLVPPDNPIQIHLLENAVGCQLLTSLVLKERRQHPRPLLPWGPTGPRVSHQSTNLQYTKNSAENVPSHLPRPGWCSAARALEPPGARSRARWIYKKVRCSAGPLR